MSRSFLFAWVNSGGLAEGGRFQLYALRDELMWLLELQGMKAVSCCRCEKAKNGGFECDAGFRPAQFDVSKSGRLACCVVVHAADARGSGNDTD